MHSGSSLLGPMKAKGKAASALFILVTLCSMLVAACGTSSSHTSGNTTHHVLTAICSVGGSYTENMSPFSPNANCGVEGLLYENLEYVNGVTGKETPVLAQGHTWSTDNKTLTFNLRTGASWSDGQAFSSADVVFTFTMMNTYKTDADPNGLWTKLSSVTASDPNTVVMTFATPAPTLLPFIEGTYIVPQHLWQSVGDPSQFTNTSNPVGTGPMKLASFSPQVIKYTKNAHFWGASQVQVDELDYPVVASNNTALLEMASHQADWTGIFSASLQQAFVSRDPTHNHVYMVPVVPVMIVPNLKNALLAQLPVRQAISAALDRQQMSASGEAGLEQVASPTGLMPGQEADLDSKYNGQLPTYGPADPTSAASILSSHGFTKGGNGFFHDAQGHELAFKVTVPGDYSDYVQDLQIAKQNLAAAGINLTLNEVSDNDYHTDRATHNFDLLMSGGFFGPTPWYYLNPLLNSNGIAGAAATNWEQWNDRATDQLLNSYATSTDANTQTQDLQQLTDIMANNLPVITVLDAIQFFEYTTVHWTGWPTPQNPYAIGSAYPLAAGDNEQVILNLQWAG
jgi:peptide/nickel transport system substrate-binding protein